ncbi:hypothetical protein [Neptunicella marina]|uniref:Uncharacterized protein n=1 Tax=Neptunicella marina TaxID=2125989 RepID=A0A8J6M2A8_9ALTE|nr:hypothetical protein [Neptunicella marina]MBC3766103.1 hypothetical protein [Neptunicella marina]
MTKFLVLLMLSIAIFSHAGEDLRDPTRPKVMVNKPGTSVADPSAPFSDIRLSAIIYNQDRQYAIINQQPRKVGDSWESYTLISMTADSVTLSRNNVEKTFDIYNINVKQDIANAF